MGRTKESEEIREKFLKELKKEGSELIPLKISKEYKNAEIYVDPRTNDTDAPQLVFFIKVWSNERGINTFWGLHKELFEKCYRNSDQKKRKNHIVLLEGSRKGYVLKGYEFDEISRSKNTDKNGDYKIYKKELENGGFRFMNFKQFVENLEVA